MVMRIAMTKSEFDGYVASLKQAASLSKSVTRDLRVAESEGAMITLDQEDVLINLRIEILTHLSMMQDTCNQLTLNYLRDTDGGSG